MLEGEAARGLDSMPSSKLHMWRSVQMSVKACLLLAAKVWSFVAYLFKRQYRTVSEVVRAVVRKAASEALVCLLPCECSPLPPDPAVQGDQV